MRARTSLAAILLTLVAACTSGAPECTEPPGAELLTDDSAFEVAIEPNPVAAGAEATLSVSPSRGNTERLNCGLGRRMGVLERF